MKKYLYHIVPFLFFGCQDVIDVEVSNEPPRLVINAVITVDTSQFVFPVGVQVNVTNSFFGEVPVTRLKQITMGGFVFNELDSGSGFYETIASPTGLVDRDHILQVQHEDQRYLARSTYASTVDFDSIYTFSNTINDKSEINIALTDDPDIDNFYLFDVGFGEWFVVSDKFFQGQQTTLTYEYERKIESGVEFEVSVLGADEAFYNYMRALIDQSEEELGLFQVPAATIRGNIINVTEIDNIDFFDNVDQPENYALGYFAVVQKFSRMVTMQ